MGDHWSFNQIKEGSVVEVKRTANALVYAFGDPEELTFKDVVKWLVELKIKIITAGFCRYCNRPSQRCNCVRFCSICNLYTHSGKVCPKNIMNSKLFKHIFKMKKIKAKMA